MNLFAIDPGLTGAIAHFRNGELIRVLDMPIIDRTVDGTQIAHYVAEADGPKVIVVEVPGVRPGESATSAFRAGENYGRILQAVSYWPLEHMRSQDWSKIVRRPAKMTRSDRKEWSRRRAIELWPDHAHLFTRVKDDGRAEAALIGCAHLIRTRMGAAA